MKFLSIIKWILLFIILQSNFSCSKKAIIALELEKCFLRSDTIFYEIKLTNHSKFDYFLPISSKSILPKPCSINSSNDSLYAFAASFYHQKKLIQPEISDCFEHYNSKDSLLKYTKACSDSSIKYSLQKEQIHKKYSFDSSLKPGWLLVYQSLLTQLIILKAGESKTLKIPLKLGNNYYNIAAYGNICKLDKSIFNDKQIQTKVILQSDSNELHNLLLEKDIENIRNKNLKIFFGKIESNLVKIE